MGNSLFDQLNKSGLVDKNKAKQAKKAKHRKNRLNKGKKTAAVSESTQRSQQLQAERAQRDRKLNHQQKQEAEKNAIAAQIRQLVEMNRIESDDSEAGLTFNFVDGKNVQRLYVTEEVQVQLVRGRLAIVKLGAVYNLVPVAVAEKISQRDATCIVTLAVSENEESSDNTDDPYADYKVPDDLMW